MGNHSSLMNKVGEARSKKKAERSMRRHLSRTEGSASSPIDCGSGTGESSSSPGAEEAQSARVSGNISNPHAPPPNAEKPPVSKSSGPCTTTKYGRPDKLGLQQVNFINVHRKDFTGRIELLKGSVEGLAKEDETDLLIVYLRQRGAYKANQDSALAALNRSGYSLAQLEKETKPQPSYRRHYHCWLSRPLPKPRPAGFEFKRLLVYEDPGEELTRDDNIVLDIMKCLTTVIGGDVQLQSVLIPLSGALLSPSMRKHFVRAAVEVSFSWLQMGLPVRNVRILLPDTDISKEIECFETLKVKLTTTKEYQIRQSINYDVFFSYAQGDKEAATEMMEYLRGKNSSIRIFDAEPREVSLRQRGVVNMETMEAISQSRIFLALLSDDYFNSVECTEAFSLAYCRDFDSQGNFIIPLFWRSCDLTPLARRLVATEGVDCRERSLESAAMLLDEIVIALANIGQPADTEDEDGFDGHDSSGVRRDQGKMAIADKLLMAKDQKDAGGQDLFDQGDKIAKDGTEADGGESRQFFDDNWQSRWAMDFSSIVFGPRIGAGGFGEVYKCKWKNKMVAVKTLQKIEDEDPQAVMAEFMVEMKLMSKLRHGNIVSFLGASIASPKLAIILEFMAGGSLYRAIHRRRRNGLGAFPLLKSLWIAFGIAKGMRYLHSQFPVIIHRDLKSPNILLGTNVREVKVTDFGLSRLRSSETYVNTGPGGTPEWMAPELLRQDPFDEQSDVFSFGVILWELMMCEKPWKDDHPMQIVFKVGSRGEKLEAPPPETCIPEVRQMIVKCFAEDPAARPKFSDLADALDNLCHRADPAKKSSSGS